MKGSSWLDSRGSSFLQKLYSLKKEKRKETEYLPIVGLFFLLDAFSTSKANNKSSLESMARQKHFESACSYIRLSIGEAWSASPHITLAVSDGLLHCGRWQLQGPRALLLSVREGTDLLLPSFRIACYLPRVQHHRPGKWMVPIPRGATRITWSSVGHILNFVGKSICFQCGKRKR